MNKAFQPDNYVQIDVLRKVDLDFVRSVICNLYTGTRCVSITMFQSDYEALIREGFFIRDGKEPDSAGVLNTTETYYLEKDITQS